MESAKKWYSSTMAIITGSTTFLIAVTTLVLNSKYLLNEFSDTSEQANKPPSSITSIINGVWISNDFYKTASADIQLKHAEGIVTGIYSNSHDNAVILNGQVTQDITSKDIIVQAIWSESTSNQRCTISRGGSEYWGKIKLRLTPAGSLVGHWGYCEKEPTTTFTGKKLSG